MLVDKSSIHYNGDRVRSYNALISFILSMRGGGKSFDFKLYVINRFLKRGEQFVYIRRYKEELKGKVQGWFDDVQKEGYYTDLKLEGKGKKLLINGKVAGYGVVLSQFITEKSDSKYTNISTIGFDEFVIPKDQHTRYLNNEVEAFFDLYETISRMREVKVFFYGNNLSVINPYFTFFGIRPDINKRFNHYKHKHIVVEYWNNQAYVEAKKNTRFGQLIAQTKYGAYAIENVALYDDEKNIEKRSAHAKYEFTLRDANVSVGLWCDFENGKIYASQKYDPNGRTFVLKADDVDADKNNYLIHNYKKIYHVNMLIKAYMEGWLYYENLHVKQQTLDMITTIKPNI